MRYALIMLISTCFSQPGENEDYYRRLGEQLPAMQKRMEERRRTLERIDQLRAKHGLPPVPSEKPPGPGK